MANASRLGGVTNINFQVGSRMVRVATDSRKAVRLLESALGALVIEPEEQPDVSFMLNRPRALQRSHSLNDRAGSVLSDGRGLDSGLAALAEHLTVLTPTDPGTVRIRSKALLVDDGAILCLAPLLTVPHVPLEDLIGSGAQLVDRLAVDIDPASGRLLPTPVPWAELAGFEAGAGHASIRAAMNVVSVMLMSMPGSPPPSRAEVVARLASEAIDGAPADILDASLRVVEDCAPTAVPWNCEPKTVLDAIRRAGE